MVPIEQSPPCESSVRASQPCRAQSDRQVDVELKKKIVGPGKGFEVTLSYPGTVWVTWKSPRSATRVLMNWCANVSADWQTGKDTSKASKVAIS